MFGRYLSKNRKIFVLLITPFSRASPTSWFGAAHPRGIKHKKMKIGAILLVRSLERITTANS